MLLRPIKRTGVFAFFIHHRRLYESKQLISLIIFGTSTEAGCAVDAYSRLLIDNFDARVTNINVALEIFAIGFTAHLDIGSTLLTTLCVAYVTAKFVGVNLIDWKLSEHLND